MSYNIYLCIYICIRDTKIDSPPEKNDKMTRPVFAYYSCCVQNFGTDKLVTV